MTEAQESGHSDGARGPAVPLARPWQSLFILTVGIVYLGVFLEWLFFATKQSFMTMIPVSAKLNVLFVSAWPIAVAAVAVVALLCGAARLVGRNWFSKVCLGVGVLVPAGYFATTVLLLVDNFSYTLFSFGIVSTSGLARAAYGVFFVGLLVGSYVLCRSWLGYLAGRRSLRWPAALAAAALIASSIVVVIDFAADAAADPEYAVETKTRNSLPNILYFCVDGLNARNMSVYGYARDTTPHMREFSRQCLIAENHFSNAGASGASFASQMTGRLPSGNRLIYPPDILRGAPVYQHLPGILRKLGYRSMDMSERYYVDPFDLNMLNSFDYANNRRSPELRMSRRLGGLLSPERCYLLSVMFDRVYQRVLHIYGLRTMSNAYAKVTQSNLFHTDQSRVDAAIDFMRAGSSKPFFMHIHLLGTHGPLFSPRTQVYSKFKHQRKFWMRNFYDDAILDADESFQRLIDCLKANGLLDRTIVIVNSDHAEGYALPYRIPLIIRFPRGEYAGHMHANTQNLDIAATIVDYLKLEKPSWLGGTSVLSGLHPWRAIYSFSVYSGGTKKVEEDLWQQDPNLIGPPFYSLGTMNAIVGNTYYELDPRNSTVKHCLVQDARTLPKNDVPTTDTIIRAMLEHLGANGWDISSIKQPLRVQAFPRPYSRIIEDGLVVREIPGRK